MNEMGVFVSHTTFVVERDLPGKPAHVFRFWTEHDLKRQWTSCHPDWTVLEDTFDVRIGGTEAIRWRTREGVEHGFRAHYLDMVPGKQIIYAYAMNTGKVQTSASLATIEFTAKGGKTKMTYTEQAAFLDARDAQGRSRGTEMGFERLVTAIERSLAVTH
jgi:uncharacterized protein YndB with AHSA1/START domain